ncbi:MAG: DegV family protein [Firmicutes bacterium]|jgi:DegV family protein with EDD domain|nr:DegV family protein [Bacillota bacterium]
MPGIQIVTDSTADLSEEIVREHDIEVVPLSVSFGDEHYIDGVDLTADEFYRKLRGGSVLPRTAQPSPGRFAEVYRKALAAGRQVVSIHISSKLSGTYQAASLAAEMVDPANILVVDSLSVSMGVGLLALAGAKHNETLDEAREAVMAAKESLGVFFLVDTFEYMEKNGRIGKAASLVGSLLQIKPVLTFVDGTVEVVEKVRGSRRSRRRMLEIFRERIGENKVHVAMLHADAKEEAQELLDEIKGSVDCVEAYLGNVGPIIGSHSGPGTLGLAWRLALPGE